MAPLQVEIWSDVVCPWCYIGKRRFEAAVEQFDGEVEVTWRSFELDPVAPPVREHTATEHLAAKYGMSREQAENSHAQMTELAAQEGLEYHFERARGGNSFDAHRLIHLATANGLQDEAMERVMRGYFTEGVVIGDREALIDARRGVRARCAGGARRRRLCRSGTRGRVPRAADRDPGRAVLRARPPLRRVRRAAGRDPRAGAGEGMRLSVLDQSPVPEGSTGPDALRNTLDLARLADQLGYHRYWLAEHHGLSLAGPSPEVLIGPVAAATERIRVGSGGVMLPHYSPFKVAENFSLLAGLYPNRIDLGIGRASGTDPLTTYALQRDRREVAPDDFPQQLAELLAHFDRTPAGGPPVQPARPLAARRGREAADLAARLVGPERGVGGAARTSRTRSRTSSTRTAPRSRAPTASRAEHAAHGGRRVGDRRRHRRGGRAARVAIAMGMAMLRQNRPIPVPPPEKALRYLEQNPAAGGRPPPHRRLARDGASTGSRPSPPSTRPTR